MKITVEIEFAGADTGERWIAVREQLSAGLSELCARIQETGWSWTACDHPNGPATIRLDPIDLGPLPFRHPPKED